MLRTYILESDVYHLIKRYKHSLDLSMVLRNKREKPMTIEAHNSIRWNWTLFGNYSTNFEFQRYFMERTLYHNQLECTMAVFHFHSLHITQGALAFIEWWSARVNNNALLNGEKRGICVNKERTTASGKKLCSGHKWYQLNFIFPWNVIF